MTTLVPEPGSHEPQHAADQDGRESFGGSAPSEIRPHAARSWAESFGRDAERYDRARPRYPEALIQRIVAGAPGREVLDVGCGTGIAARQLVAAGCRVLGVDVDPRMAEVARGHGIEVEVGKFEDWDPAGRGFDLVTAAQAWHWVEAGAGARQAGRVLRPHGRLALFWNVAIPADAALAEAFAGVYRSVLGEHPIFGRALTRPVAGFTAFNDRANEGVRAAGVFEEPEDWRYEWSRTYTRDEWIDVVPTQGGHNTLTPEQLERVLAGLADVVDAAGGSFLMNYDVTVATAVRRAG